MMYFLWAIRYKKEHAHTRTQNEEPVWPFPHRQLSALSRLRERLPLGNRPTRLLPATNVRCAEWPVLSAGRPARRLDLRSRNISAVSAWIPRGRPQLDVQLNRPHPEGYSSRLRHPFQVLFQSVSRHFDVVFRPASAASGHLSRRTKREQKQRKSFRGLHPSSCGRGAHE